MRFAGCAFWFGLAFGVASVVVFSGCNSPEARVRDIEPQVDSVLRDMCRTLDDAKTFQFSVTATMDQPVETGQLAQFHRASHLVIAKPDRLYATIDSDEGQWTAWQQGRTLTVLDRDLNEYATEEVPGRVGPMLDHMADTYDLIVPMADFLVDKTYDSLLTNVESGAYLGLHNVGNAMCHHLLFRQENIDWQIWIDAGPKPVPRKFVITYRQAPDQPQYIATMDEWDFAPATSDSTFNFVPPPESKQVNMADLVAEE